MTDRRSPCNVRRCDGKKGEEVTKSFFQRTGKFILIFIIIGIAAVVLATIAVTVNVLYGGTITLLTGYAYTDLAVIISFIISLTISPIIIIYVGEQRKKIMGN